MFRLLLDVVPREYVDDSNKVDFITVNAFKATLSLLVELLILHDDAFHRVESLAVPARVWRVVQALLAFSHYVVRAAVGRRVLLRGLVVLAFLMDANEDRVVNDLTLRKEVGVFLDDIHELLLVVPANSELLALLDEIVVLQGNRVVSLLPFRELSQPSLGRPLQVVSVVDPERGTEHVVHNAEVQLLLRGR